MRQRSLTARNLLDKKVGKVVTLQNEILKEVIGDAEARNAWLIYGREKNGKTWLSLRLAKDLCYNEKVAYISAEEGMEKSFQDAVKRAGITPRDKILFDEYMSLEEVVEKYKKPKTARIIFLDNLTIFDDEMKQMKLRHFVNALPGKLIIFVAHEERKLPYPASARMASKLAKVIINVVGLRAHVVSRFSKGGTFDIDPDKCQLLWGAKEEESVNN